MATGLTSTQIWEQHSDKLKALVCCKVNHQDHCHDIMQDVYIKVMQHIDKVERAENVKSYLFKIADNAVTDHYRKKVNQAYDNVSEDVVGEEEMFVKGSSLQLADCCLRPMMDSLPAIYRDALIMTELEGMKLKDYAEKAGISLSNAKVRVQRGKEKLKEIILQCCNYEFDRYGNIIDCQKNNQSGCCKK
jgi:RNA polymerase sigma-70 factor, ECF subfamily